MNRRSFVAGIVGLFASAKALATPHPVSLGEEGYTYDWSGKTSTDDPRFAGRSLPYGQRDVHGIWIDGRDAMDIEIYKLKTGPDGYVKYFVRDSNGNHYEEVEGELAKRMIRGTVRYLPVGGFPSEKPKGA